MATDYSWTRATPELAYSSTDSTGEHNEDLQSPATPEAQIAGLASFSDSTFDASFTGAQYTDYEPRAAHEIFDKGCDPEATCALYAQIGFESQQAANGHYELHPSDQGLEFGQIQGENAAAKGSHVLNLGSGTRYDDRRYFRPIGSASVVDLMLDSAYVPPCFSDVHAPIECFHCGLDPTVLYTRQIQPEPSGAAGLPVQSDSSSPPPLPVVSRPKIRITPLPAASPKQTPRAATCYWCGKTFSRSAGLPRHQQTACRKRPVEVRTSQFACNICGETRSRKDKIRHHCQKKHKQGQGQEKFTERK